MRFNKIPAAKYFKMSTSIAKGPPPASEAILLSVTDDVIDRYEEQYLMLKCDGVDDRHGLKVVHEARMECVRARTTIDKVRKQMGEESRKYIENVNNEAKRLTSRLAPIETYLKEQEDAVDAELERRKQAKEDELYAVRLERLTRAGAKDVIETFIRKMSETEFEAEVKRVEAVARLAHEEEMRRFEEETQRQKERAAEVERNRLEAEKLAAERAEMQREREKHQAIIDAENARQAAIRSEQEAAQRAIEAAQKKLADDEAARQRAIQLETARLEAAEKARIETEQRIAREAEAARTKAEQEAAAKARAEAARPDIEKLLSVADLIDGIVLPKVSDAAETQRLQIHELITATTTKIRQIAVSVR